LYSIEYYEEDGKFPVIDFLNTLNAKESAKILREIDLLEKYGFSLGMPYIKKIEGTSDLWELRIKHSSNIFRVFYFHYIKGQFVLVHAIIKKTEKTPKRDLEISLSRINKYLKRKDVEI
jgi:phage-related protein